MDSGETAQVSATHPLRLLIVDDNADAAETLSMLLEEYAAEVRLAHSGRQALTVAAELRPHVVFLDIGLPDLNGLEVARLLRAAPHGEHAVLIAVTGYGQEKDRAETKAAGFDHHFLKPLDPEMVEAFLSGPALAAVVAKF